VSDEFVSVKAINLRRSADALHLAVNEDRHKLLPAPSFLAPFARCQFSFLLCHGSIHYRGFRHGRLWINLFSVV
jgi:hypothetical protein